MSKRPDIEMQLLGLSKIYKEELSDPLIDIWVEVLADIPPEEINRAVKTYIREQKNVFFPKPGQIYGLCRPDDSEGEAVLIAERMWTAICRYGTDRVGEEKAQAFIASDAGWAFIQNSGGWYNFNTGVSDIEQAGMLKSQWRKGVFELMQKRKRGDNLSLIGNSPKAYVPQIENSTRAARVEDAPHASIEDMRKYLRPMQTVPTEDVQMSEKEINERRSLLKRQAESLEKNKTS